jgi:TPP-dependent 2-oxoacid decarboxylase
MMLRCTQNNIIFLINNGEHTIEVEIHDGPYNVIKNWNYTGLVDAIHNGEGKCWTAKVSTVHGQSSQERPEFVELLLMDVVIRAGEVRGEADSRY